MLETKRLLLRPFQEQDVQDVYEYAKEPEVGNAAGWKPHTSPEETKHIVLEVFMKDQKSVTYAIVDRANDKVIGSISYCRDPHRNYAGCVNIGYVLHPAYWGNNLMKEAVYAVLREIFTNTYHDIVSVEHATDNVRSKRVIEKCGFQYEGTLRRSALHLWSGELKDHCVYSLTKEEFFAQNGEEVRHL